MATIEATVMINASLDKVWNVVSDIDNEPKFWKGTKEIRNISREGNIVKREITIAFRDQKCLQTVTLTPEERIEAVFTEGVIKGTKTIHLKSINEKTELKTIWDIKLSGMMGMFTGMIKKHIQSGTEQALQSIKNNIES
jgi:ribosome-associated toxin RatA of RatAB toxin-antitoxin module